MNINELKKSSFLTKTDCGPGILVTIKSVQQENVASQGAPEELKYCVFFDELEKPMVLNSTNGQIIAGITGSEESDNWVGHKIVLYNDPNISFAGKITGGIRARAPKKQAARPAPATATPSRAMPAPKPASPAPTDKSQPPTDDDCPF
jgi:hypothetical protein